MSNLELGFYSGLLFLITFSLVGLLRWIMPELTWFILMLTNGIWGLYLGYQMAKRKYKV